MVRMRPKFRDSALQKNNISTVGGSTAGLLRAPIGRSLVDTEDCRDFDIRLCTRHQQITTGVDRPNLPVGLSIYAAHDPTSADSEVVSASRKMNLARGMIFLSSTLTTLTVLDDPLREELEHSKSFESTDVQEITPFLPGDTVAYLRLADEERKFPFRPISSGLFLIGQGPGCDLRLGLDDMPAIHSAIQISDTGAELTKIAETPDLLVNGEPVERIHLEHGDMIEVGDVHLAFFLCSHSAAVTAERSLEHNKLSARQLIDGLEFELDLLDADSSRTDRISELLRAAQQAVDACQFAQTIRFADYAARNAAPEAVPQSDSYLQVLNRLSSQETRLDEICNVLEQVVHQQQMIATALQCVVERLDDMRSATQPGSMRASA